MLFRGYRQTVCTPFFHHTDTQLGLFSGFPPHADTKVAAARTLEWTLGEALGKSTAFPALALALPWGHADRHFVNQPSWVGDSQRADIIARPDVLAEKMFGIKLVDSERKRQTTILDFYKQEIDRLTKKVGAADKSRLDMHLNSIREIEQQLASSTSCKPFAGGDIPQGENPGDELAMQAMTKLIIYAFQCDLTRHISIWIANSPPRVPGGDDMSDHNCSHDINHGDNLWFHDKKMQYWKGILEGFKESKEGDQSILFNSMCLSATDVTITPDGDPHGMENLPFLLAGNAGGKIKTGRHLKHNGVPYTNMMLTIQKAMGLDADSFGTDGKSVLPGLMG